MFYNKNKVSEYLEALEANFSKAPNKKTKTYQAAKTNNRFNSFSQRSYTSEELDELERKLLSK
jgi:hypothetical protein